MKTMTAEVQSEMTPDQALELLMAGNLRFTAGVSANRDLHRQVQTTASGQFPMAVVQGCIDSRVPLELVFD